MEIKNKVLIIEDERRISNFLSTVLKANNFEIITADTGANACAVINSHCPDLIVLDLGLPDMDGTEILKSVRQWSSMPIIVVSARTDERDKVMALEMGADDYITKPFGTKEFVARINTAIRHTRTVSANDNIAVSGIFVSGDLTIDYTKYRAYINGEDVNLTQNEFKIVALLGKNAGKVLTYDYIIRQLWGPHAKTDNQILRVNMANIRRKIEKKPAEPQYIFTEVGVGYRMADGDSAQEKE